MSRPTGYSLMSYGDMVTDEPRMASYAAALVQAVQPGCVVLDIGAGAGIFSLLACQFGAGNVHAVEPHEAIGVARSLAAANGYEDRITFHQALSTEITLPQPADVIISDLRGVLPLFQQHIPAIVDARRRLLAPGGRLIPRRDHMWAALVEDAELYRRYHEPWLANSYSLDMRDGHPLVVNTWRKVNAKPGQLLTEPSCWATLDYATIESPNVSAEVTWVVSRPGTVHGLLIWFDAELGDDIGFSNAPGCSELIYGQAFFPLQEAIALVEEEQVRVSLAANLVDDEYVWRWKTEVLTSGGEVKASFQQSTLFGVPLSLENLRKRGHLFTPSRNLAAEIDAFVLTAMDGCQTNGEIAAQLHARFPGRFRHERDALGYVANLSVKYSR
jgi:type I protein arginine methyltransferase